MHLTVTYPFTPKQPTVRTSQVMDLFGIDFEQDEHILACDFELPLQPGQLICFTGESGSGKSSLMRALARQLEDVINIDDLPLPDKPLIDGLNLETRDGLQLLSACGLGEAHLLLRTPSELSDGQRYRFRLALAISQQPRWIMADEFTATLDRTLAKVVAFNLHRLRGCHPLGFLLATTHEDILEDLQPDWHVQCRLGSEPELKGTAMQPDQAEPVKKKSSASQTTSGSAKRPKPTGRISLGGIIAPTRSASSER